MDLKQIFVGVSFIEKNGKKIPKDIPFLSPLNKGATFFINPRAVVSIKGNDRVSFLQGLTTNDVKLLKVGEATRSFFTNNKGKIHFDSYLYKLEEEILIFLNSPNLESFVEHLSHFHIIEDVEISISDTNLITLDLITLKNINDSCLSFSALGANKIFQNVKNTHAVFLLDESKLTKEFILKAQEKDTFPIGDIQFNVLRPYIFYPKFDQDFNENHFPHEISLEEFVSFKKGCFVGQEPIARIQNLGKVNKKLYSFYTQDQEVQIGCNFIDNGKDVGTVTSISSEKIDEHYWGLAVFKTKWVDQLEETKNLKLNHLISIKRGL